MLIVKTKIICPKIQSALKLWTDMSYIVSFFRFLFGGEYFWTIYIKIDHIHSQIDL